MDTNKDGQVNYYEARNALCRLCSPQDKQIAYEIAGADINNDHVITYAELCQKFGIGTAPATCVYPGQVSIHACMHLQWN